MLLLDNSSEQLNETSENMDENTLSSGQGDPLPILKKIIDLSTKAKVNYECWFYLLDRVNESKSF
jgi:hypothetical protein